jgi:hydroxymethylpyrimidine/phosphomethylpyrimidine kinase
MSAVPQARGGHGHPGPAVALTVAGSDSGGGAGVQADLRTFTALGLHGTSAVTAVTAQDTCGVRSVHPVPTPTVVAQVVVVLDDFAVATVKTGMLATAETVRAVGRLAEAGRLPRLVVDPVLRASGGRSLIAAAARTAYLEQLLPYAAVVTPNLDEAEALLRAPVRTLAERRAAAEALAGLGPAVVVTGGHDTHDDAHVVDVLHAAGRTYELVGPRIVTRNSHGTGCTFSAALAARLALGDDVPAATCAAKHYVTAALRAAVSWRLGRGAGPLPPVRSAPPSPEETS